MNSPKADDVHARLMAAYGQNWSDRIWDDLRVEADAPEADIARPGEDEDITVTFTPTLRIPLAAYERLLARALESYTDRDDLLSEWVATEATAPDVPAISRDDVLRILARRHPRSA